MAPRQTDATQRVVIDPKLETLRWLGALEYKPGDRRVVHSIDFTILETGQRLGFGALLAKRMPSRPRLVAEIHGCSRVIFDCSGPRRICSVLPGTSKVAAGALPVIVSTYRGAVAAPRFKLSGTLKEVDAAGCRLVIAHSDIPGFMGTMSCTVGKGADLENIAVGDQIESELVVGESGLTLRTLQSPAGRGESGDVLATAREHVLVNHGLRRFLAAAAAHADRKPRLYVAQRGGAAINCFMNLAIGDRATDAYVHGASGSRAQIINENDSGLQMIAIPKWDALGSLVRQP
ncbi:MAG: copper-binding protein [Steroidobacteraceae bacterium]